MLIGTSEEFIHPGLGRGCGVGGDGFRWDSWSGSCAGGEKGEKQKVEGREQRAESRRQEAEGGLRSIVHRLHHHSRSRVEINFTRWGMLPAKIYSRSE
ncbi:MAG: hypothetical protein FJ031_11410 [Chloroflexi bacterium]|nr:hypothetical protein [Chloroflexota bacterium]